MTWLIVAGDLTPLGGMDAANHALARYLASRDEVHLVTHRAWPDLAALPTVTVHRVWRPLNRHLLGSPLLSRTGQRVWRRLRSSSARAIVNGGNCRIAGVNWVHYLHAAQSALERRLRRASGEGGADPSPRSGGGARGASSRARRHLQQPADA